MSARPIFIGGTSSNAGKSWMATAVCAALRARGVRVAPFKAQTMSNHSYPCLGGGEIGRAQVAQAEACGLEPEPSMNPILLKPNGNGTSQVVVRGRMWKTLPARGYYAYFDELMVEVLSAYHDLASRFDAVVIEGAGSVSELNLQPFDLVNLGLVTRLAAPWVLVADIERGGVFGSVVGTVSLLSAEQRALFRGFLINKFRGDLTLFDEGRTILEAKTGAPCLGVFPYADGLHVDAEDSLAVDRRSRSDVPAGASIAIVQLPRLSNGTDFRLLTWAEWIDSPVDARHDFVILPGTKDTLGDLQWMRDRGLDRWIHDQHRRGATIVGICGGYQMLGQRISDPRGMESRTGTVDGLALLPVDTVLSANKTICRVRAATRGGVRFDAYEIHLGVTSASRSSSSEMVPFAFYDDGAPEGLRGERVLGTYLHGAFENAELCTEVFGVPVMAPPSKAESYRGLADWFDRYAERTEEWMPC